MAHELLRVSNRIFYMTFGEETDRPNLGYVRGDRFSLMFDCGASVRHVCEYRRLLREAGLPFPNFAILSHWHWDHALGMNALDIPVIAGRKTNDKLKEVSVWEWTEQAMRHRLETGEDILFCWDMVQKEHGKDLSAIPRFRTADIVFEEEMELDLGGVSCRLACVGGPHSEDSVVCHVPEERFLLLSDSSGKDLFGTPWEYDPKHPEKSGEAMDAMPYDETRLADYLRRLEEFDFHLCLKGHEACMDRETFLASLR